MTEDWTADSIRDAAYRAKFVDVPDVIAEWAAEAGGVAGRDVLDFGCGEATMALGMALRKGARRVVGIDIHEEIDNALPYAQAQLGLSRLPPNLEVIRVQPDAPLEPLGSFDVIYSWSVFEHVQQDLIVDCLAKMKRVLRPGGVMFLQTTPLYYSAFGSHFQPWIPVPWAHLSMQHDLYSAALRKAAADAGQADGLLSMYESLNRATGPQILRAARAAGFAVVREHRTYDEDPIPGDLLEVYAEDVLRTNQLVFLARHAEDVPAARPPSGLEEGGRPPEAASAREPATPAKARPGWLSSLRRK